MATQKTTPQNPPGKKKKKRSVEQMHRTVQDQVQALPYAIAHFEKEGKRGKAFMLKYVSGPILKVLNRLMSRSRYRGTGGAKLKQSEQMKRHLEQRRQAMQYVQGELQKAQKQQMKRGKTR